MSTTSPEPSGAALRRRRIVCYTFETSMAASLGSVLEPDDGAAGPRGRLTVDVLEGWLEPGVVLEIVVPARLACARCEGGGCDACARSGAVRLTGSEEARTFELTLSGPARGLRLPRPLGADAGLDQLIVELRPAAVPSTFCRRVERDIRRSQLAAVLVLVGLVAAALAAFVLRR